MPKSKAAKVKPSSPVMPPDETVRDGSSPSRAIRMQHGSSPNPDVPPSPYEDSDPPNPYQSFEARRPVIFDFIARAGSLRASLHLLQELMTPDEYKIAELIADAETECYRKRTKGVDMSKIQPWQIARIEEGVRDGRNPREIAKEIGVSPATVQRRARVILKMDVSKFSPNR